MAPMFGLTTSGGRMVARHGRRQLWVASAGIARRRVNGAGTTRLVPQARGWIAVEDLADGDLVLVPETVHTVGDAVMPAGQAALLGYLLGDGGTTADIRFSQMEGPALNEFLRIVEQLGGRVAELKSKGKHREIGVRAIAGTQENPILRLAREWKIYGCTAKTKRLPNSLWRLTPSELATIGGRLFACDGTVWTRTEQTVHGKSRKINEVRLELALANEGLVKDFHRMMLRLGVVGTIRTRTTLWNGSRVNVWQWTCTRAGDIQRFSEVIDAPGKNERLAEAAHVAAGRRFEQAWMHEGAPEGYRWEKVVHLEHLGEEWAVDVEVDQDQAWVDLLVEGWGH